MLPSLILLPPFLASLVLAVGLFGSVIGGERHERLTNGLTFGAVAVSALAVVAAAIGSFVAAGWADSGSLGPWFSSGDYRVDLSFEFGPPNLVMAGLSSGLGLVVVRFCSAYLHREDGFHRFHLILNGFVFAMLLLSLAGNAVLAFTGWELAGVCSYLLIGYAYDRPNATVNATRAFVTNRIGDAGFVLGIASAFVWVGSIEFAAIANAAERLASWQANALCLFFLLAAFAKSAQVPFSPWITRAMEGPTPSSAVFYGGLLVHAGAFLVLRMEGLFSEAPVAMAIMASLGLLTALYGFLTGLTQADVKSSLIFATLAQVGLIFFEAGLGWWTFALAHLAAHALFRTYQFLSSPSLMHQILDTPVRPVLPILGNRRWVYLASLQRFWLEPLTDWMLVRPVRRLSDDLVRFDEMTVERVTGGPAGEAETGGAADPNAAAGLIRVSGLAGRVLAGTANMLHWFEDRLVLRGVGLDMLHAGRRLGRRLNAFEAKLNEPRYLVILVFAVLLTVL